MLSAGVWVFYWRGKMTTLSSFRERNECEETGVITALVDKDRHSVAVCRNYGVWMYASQAMGEMSREDQNFCIQRNFEAELHEARSFNDVPTEN
jgi:hypothetical protein